LREREHRERKRISNGEHLLPGQWWRSGIRLSSPILGAEQGHKREEQDDDGKKKKRAEHSSGKGVSGLLIKKKEAITESPE
jgi:hypothetical protein